MGTQHGCANLADDVTQWRTPDAPGAWPTPSSRDEKNPNRPESGNFQRKLAMGWTIDLSDVSACWTTPDSRDWKSGEASQETLGRNARPLNEAVTNWRTPNTRDHHAQGPRDNHPQRQTTLVDQSNIWGSSPPAPETRPGQRSFPPTRSLRRLSHISKLSARDSLLLDCWTMRLWAARRRRSATVWQRPHLRRKLSASFVEWLMGWPVGLTDARPGCGPVEMASWRSRARLHLRSWLSRLASEMGRGQGNLWEVRDDNT